ncbi:hypothetical protein I6F11_04330 [Ensifer sp. NBAIM29]|nr:hypothetical protein [Ensifer sp. NBAIM29]
MNLRILKKLSKRAAPLLPLLGDRREQFRSERGDNYHKAFIGDRKHWQRSFVHPTYQGRNEWRMPRAAEIVFATRAGRIKAMRPPSHPRKGTIMLGWMDGGEQPEWDEECAWIALKNHVLWHFTDFDKLMDDDCPPGGALTRSLRTPREVFAAAADIIAESRERHR